MPRAALLSLHARVEGVEPSAWEDPRSSSSGGRATSAYVVAEAGLPAVLARRLPETRKGRRPGRADGRAAARAPRRPSDDGPRAGRALGIGQRDQVCDDDGYDRHPLGGGARAGDLEGRRGRRSTRPTRGASSRGATCTSSGRRRADGFAQWAGISARRPPTRSRRSSEAAAGRLAARQRVAARRGRARVRAAAAAAAPARLLPSGDAYFLLWERNASCSSRRKTGAARSGRAASGRARCWSTARSAAPGAGRATPCGSRAGSRSVRGARAVEAEAASLPLPGNERRIEVSWEA